METTNQDQKNPGLRTAIFGTIFTSDIKNKWAEVVIYQDDEILFVGEKANAEPFLTDSTKRVTLDPEQLLLPGFVDSHIHLVYGGFQITGQTIEACCSLKEVQRQIQEFLTSSPETEWVLANGYSEILFPGGEPHRKHLDEICPDKPMAFKKFDCHSYLVNTRALEIAGITKDTPDPPSGTIEKDADGIPTGCLREKAMDLVENHFPEKAAVDTKRALEASAKEFVQEGITSYMDALVATKRCKLFYDFYAEHSEKLPKGYICLGWDKVLEQAVDSSQEGPINFYELMNVKEHEKLKINGIKFFVDGVLETKTALLHEPYVGEDKNYGIQLYEEDYLKKYVTKLHQKGVQTHYHAIGDKAINMTLDVLEHVQEETKAENLKDPRHIIAHLQLVQESDYARFGKVKAHSSITPLWMWNEPISKEQRYAILDEKRASAVQYPVKSIMKYGGVVSFGSDWPVTTLRPLVGIEVALTRKEPGNGNKDDEPWHGHECLTVEEAVLAYTLNSAYLCHQENSVGSLEVGKKADFVLLDKNIFRCEPHTIHKTQVLTTIIDGKVIVGHL